MNRSQKHVIIIRPLPMEDILKDGKLHPPLGSLYLARSLIDSGYYVSLIDQPNEETLQEIQKIVSKHTIGFGISSMSGTQLKNALIIAGKLKSKYPDIPLIWGGVHATSLPEQTLKHPLVDYIVWGEGEEIFPVLLNAIQSNNLDSLNEIPGIGFENGDKPVLNLKSGYTDLGKIFNLPYDLLDMNRYARELVLGAKRAFPILTSRGCPYKCRFCSNSSRDWPNKVRFHTIDHIVNDIRNLVEEYRADLITFNDENFLLSEKRFIKILEALKSEGITVKLRFAARIDQLLKLKETTWELMKNSSVVNIGIAPESGSQKILDYMGKNLNLDQVYQADDLINKFGFYKSFNFLICTPEETKEDLNLTLKLVSNLARSSLDSPYPFGTLHKYIPLPGTEMYYDAIESGFVPPDILDDWTRFDFENLDKTRDTVRPWISKDYFIYVNTAINLIEKLNLSMKGQGADKKVILDNIKEIDQFINN